MKKLFYDIRFFVLVISFLFSIGAYFVSSVLYPDSLLLTIRLTQLYAFTSIVYLYLALLSEPLIFTFKNLPFREVYLKLKDILIVGAFYFSFIHFFLAFFGQLGGFEGLGFLSAKYLIAIGLSFAALIILFLAVITAINKVMLRMNLGLRKLVHTLVYVAGLFVLIHAVMLGTHLQELGDAIPQILIFSVAFLLFLELLRIDVYVARKFSALRKVSLITVPVFSVLLVVCGYFLIPFPSNGTVSFGIHSQHIQIAKDAQTVNNSPSKIPGLQGDKTRRFTVDTDFPKYIAPNTDTVLKFKVFDASSGNQVKLFNKVFGKTVHMIVVDSKLSYFNHIHPEQTDEDFAITTQFPKEGVYHIYFDFQPFGAIEQQIATTVRVGSVGEAQLSTEKPDKDLTKTFGEYEITLKYPSPLTSEALSIGQQILGFTILDAVTKKPITTLKPYLEAYGHLVMINEKTFDYVHVHPNDLRVPKPDQNGGPVVEFMPLGILGPIKPGIYRVFVQFNPNGQLMVAEYTIEIK